MNPLQPTAHRTFTFRAAEHLLKPKPLGWPTIRTSRQSRGSGRHFHQNPWRKVPVRRYDPDNTDHVALATLAERAEEIAEAWLASPDAQADRRGQVALSSRIRKLLREEGVFGEIDRMVRRILPQQTL